MSAPLPTPHVNQEAEARILWACMQDPITADEVVGLVSKDDFWGHANRVVFGAILELTNERAPTDPVTIAHKLRSQKKLEAIGGAPYLAELMDGTPATPQVHHYCRIVADLARLRRANDIFTRLAAESRQPIESPDAWLGKAEAEIYESTRKTIDHEAGVAVGDIAVKVYANMGAASRGEVAQGYKMGFYTLDRQTGGCRGKELWYIAGRPGAGKTSFVVQAGEHIATQGAAVLIYSLEMDKEGLVQRIISRHCRIPYGQCRDGRLDQEQWARAAKIVDYLGKLPLCIDDAEGLTPRKLRARIRRDHSGLERKFGKELPLGAVIVDYTQLMAPDVATDATRAEQLGEVSRGLKQISMEFDTCVLAISALKRVDPGKKRQPPDMDDLRESGALEYDANNILMVHRDDQYKGPNEQHDGQAELLLRKGRNVGDGHHYARFDGRYTLFEDLHQPEQEDLWR